MFLQVALVLGLVAAIRTGKLLGLATYKTVVMERRGEFVGLATVTDVLS